jgi:chromosome segregation ATPase
MGRDNKTVRALNEARETIAACALRLTAANKQMADLQRELAAARERLFQQQNETLSLRKSLELSTAENSRLSLRLSQSAAAADKANGRVERARAERIAAEADRDGTKRMLDEQIAALNTELEATSARARSAETHASEMRQNLLNGSAENARARRQIAECDGVLKQKEQQIQALRQAQSNLLEGIKSRDVALARAEERSGRLTELFLQLEAKAGPKPPANQVENIETLLPGQSLPRREADGSGKSARLTSAMLRRDLESDAWLFGGGETLRRA